MTQEQQVNPRVTEELASRLRDFCEGLPAEQREIMEAILRLAAEQVEVSGYVSPRLLGAAAAIALVVGGAGVIQSTRGATQHAAAAAGLASRWATGAGESRSVYLVSSQTQAEAVRTGLDDGSRAARNFEVVVVGSADEEAQALRTIMEANRIRAENGLSEIRLIDLRTAASVVGGGGGDGETPSHTS